MNLIESTAVAADCIATISTAITNFPLYIILESEFCFGFSQATHWSANSRTAENTTTSVKEGIISIIRLNVTIS